MEGVAARRRVPTLSGAAGTKGRKPHTRRKLCKERKKERKMAGQANTPGASNNTRGISSITKVAVGENLVQRDLPMQCK